MNCVFSIRYQPEEGKELKMAFAFGLLTDRCFWTFDAAAAATTNDDDDDDVYTDNDDYR